MKLTRFVITFSNGLHINLSAKDENAVRAMAESKLLSAGPKYATVTIATIVKA